MTNEFKKLTNQNETRYILEMTSGGTGSSAVASNGATPTNSIGELHRRLQELKDKITVPVNQKPRQGPLKPQTGAGAHRDKKKEQKQGVEKHKKPFYENEPDHEISMASSELQSIAADAANLLDIVKQRSEEEGLEAWQQSKITKAADFMNSVLQSIRGDEDQGVAEGNGSWKNLGLSGEVNPQMGPRLKEIRDFVERFALHNEKNDYIDMITDLAGFKNLGDMLRKSDGSIDNTTYNEIERMTSELERLGFTIASDWQNEKYMKEPRISEFGKIKKEWYLLFKKAINFATTYQKQQGVAENDYMQGDPNESPKEKLNRIINLTMQYIVSDMDDLLDTFGRKKVLWAVMQSALKADLGDGPEDIAFKAAEMLDPDESEYRKSQGLADPDQLKGARQDTDFQNLLGKIGAKEGVAESDGLNEYETHVYTDSQGRKWRVNDEGERELLSDPNSRYGSNRSGSRYSGRASSMQSSGMYFYNVKPGQENDALSAGLRQTKNGKWYSKFSNSAADKAFGPGKFWQPKSESVAEGDWGWDPPSKKPPERNPDWDREHDQGMDRPKPNLRPSQDVIDAEKKAAEIKQAELQRTMAALARMRGDTSEGKGQKGVDEAHGNSKIYDKCWTGFRKVPGKKRGEEDSCTKIKKEDAYINRLMAQLESKK